MRRRRKLPSSASAFEVASDKLQELVLRAVRSGLDWAGGIDFRRPAKWFSEIEGDPHEPEALREVSAVVAQWCRSAADLVSGDQSAIEAMDRAAKLVDRRMGRVPFFAIHTLDIVSLTLPDHQAASRIDAIVDAASGSGLIDPPTAMVLRSRVERGDTIHEINDLTLDRLIASLDEFHLPHDEPFLQKLRDEQDRRRT